MIPLVQYILKTDYLCLHWKKLTCMIKKRTGLLFGPAGATAGAVILFAGIAMYNSFVGLFLILLGLFFVLTHTGTILDTNRNLVSQFTAVFGLIKFLEKENLDSFTGITILPDNERFRVFSNGNRHIDTSTGKVIIALVDENTYNQVIVGKYKSVDKARKDIQEISNQIKIPILKIQVDE